MFAVSCVGLSTVVVLTVMPAPTFTVLTPAMKLVPVNTTLSVCSRSPVAGATEVSVGAGLLTVKVWVAVVPPPGVAFVTEKVRGPVAAAAVIVRFAVICVGPFTVVVFSVIPAPTFTVLAPVMKLVPVNTTSSVWSRLPLVVPSDVRVGSGFSTVKVWGALVTPGVFVTVKLRPPVVAAPVMVMLAVICVALLTVVVLTVMPGPTSTELAPFTKPVPVKMTLSVWSRSPVAGTMAVSVGAGLLTVKF